MKTVLIILPNLPYPLDSGGNIAVYEMLNKLHTRLKLILLVPETPMEIIQGFKLKFPMIELQFYNRRKSKVKSLYDTCLYLLYYYYFKFIAKGIGVNVTRLESGNYRDSLFFSYMNKALILKTTELINVCQPDYIQIEFFKLLPLIEFIPQSVNGKTIFVHHEIRYIRLERQFRSFVEGITGIRSFMLSQIKGLELELLKKYDTIVTLSDNDRDILQGELTGKNIVSSPLFLPPSEKFNISNYTFDNTIVFVGGSHHSPNKDGLIWFVNEIWPLVLKMNVDLKLKVIGKWDNESKSEVINASGVIFKGYVEDLYSEIKNSILIVPIRIGSGIRIKILDAVNMGIPFVSTKIGVEGLNFENDMHCYIEAKPSNFAEALVRLSMDPLKQMEFIKSAKNKLEEEYSVDELVEKRFNVYV